MALSENAFITVSEVKEHLDISVTTWDSVIERLINMCTSYAQNYCGGRRFITPATDETQLYDGTDENKIFLRDWPVQSVTSIAYASGDYDNPTWNIMSGASEYRVDERRGIVTFTAISRGIQNIRVLYKGGYPDIDSVPWDLKLGLMEAVSKEFNRRKSQGANSEGVGGASVSWNIQWDPNFTSILDNYRRFL